MCILFHKWHVDKYRGSIYQRCLKCGKRRITEIALGEEIDWSYLRPEFDPLNPGF